MGPQTTLLVSEVTDMQDLWECMEASAVDACLTLHDKVMRRVAARYTAYECSKGGHAEDDVYLCEMA